MAPFVLQRKESMTGRRLARAVLREAVACGVNQIDTSDFQVVQEPSLMPGDRCHVQRIFIQRTIP